PGPPAERRVPVLDYTPRKRRTATARLGAQLIQDSEDILNAIGGTCIMKSPSGFPTCETRPAYQPSGSAPASPVEAARHPPSVRCAIDPTADPVARRILPDSARPHLHYPGWPLPSPRPSPGSSACTPCQLMNGPSLHPSG